MRRLPHNKQLQQTVIRRRGDRASAPFHCARAPRWTCGHAAAELQRSPPMNTDAATPQSRPVGAL